MNHSTPGLPVPHQLPEFTQYEEEGHVIVIENVRLYLYLTVNHLYCVRKYLLILLLLY